MYYQIKKHTAVSLWNTQVSRVNTREILGYDFFWLFSDQLYQMGLDILKKILLTMCGNKYFLLKIQPKFCEFLVKFPEKYSTLYVHIPN